VRLDHMHLVWEKGSRPDSGWPKGGLNKGESKEYPSKVVKASPGAACGGGSLHSGSKKKDSPYREGGGTERKKIRSSWGSLFGRMPPSKDHLTSAGGAEADDTGAVRRKKKGFNPIGD